MSSSAYLEEGWIFFYYALRFLIPSFNLLEKDLLTHIAL
jgi:hypothetical protein